MATWRMRLPNASPRAIAKPHLPAAVDCPLAVPEITYKLTALVIIESIAHNILGLFPSIQLECGIRGGQLALERGGSVTVTLRLDFHNAFNDRSRRTAAAIASCSGTSSGASLWPRETHRRIQPRPPHRRVPRW